MLLANRMSTLLIAGLALGWTASLSAQAPAPPPPPPTLWNFLGIPQGMHKVHDAVANKHGKFPGLERKPALKQLADPRLAAIDNPAIQAAQAIKAEEDLAPQKIKAIRYLATIGCGTGYKGVDVALLEALKDPTERVRYEAVRAVAATPSERCRDCDNSCCTKEIVEELSRMAYEREPGRENCWYEPSARVRAAAVEALGICCPGGPPILEEQMIVPPDGEPLRPASLPVPLRVAAERSVVRRSVTPSVQAQQNPSAAARETIWVGDEQRPTQNAPAIPRLPFLPQWEVLPQSDSRPQPQARPQHEVRPRPEVRPEPVIRQPETLTQRATQPVISAEPAVRRISHELDQPVAEAAKAREAELPVAVRQPASLVPAARGQR